MNNTNFHGFTSAIVFYTYNGKARFGLQRTNNVKMDLSKLLNNVVSNVQEEVAKISKSD